MISRVQSISRSGRGSGQHVSSWRPRFRQASAFPPEAVRGPTHSAATFPPARPAAAAESSAGSSYRNRPSPRRARWARRTCLPRRARTAPPPRSPARRRGAKPTNQALSLRFSLCPPLLLFDESVRSQLRRAGLAANLDARQLRAARPVPPLRSPRRTCRPPRPSRAAGSSGHSTASSCHSRRFHQVRLVPHAAHGDSRRWRAPVGCGVTVSAPCPMATGDGLSGVPLLPLRAQLPVPARAPRPPLRPADRCRSRARTPPCRHSTRSCRFPSCCRGVEVDIAGIARCRCAATPCRGPSFKWQ